MNYQELYGCLKCDNIDENDECKRKNAFDDNDPSTSPFLHCPFFVFNYDLIIPKSGDFYIFESNGVLYTPIFLNLETTDSIQLRKCEIFTNNNMNHLILDLKYPFIIDRKKQLIIDNCPIVHIDTTTIIKQS